MTDTPNVLFEVTLSGVLVSEDGESLPASQDFEAAVERLADLLYEQVEDATVSGRCTSGEVQLWFSRPSEMNPHSDLTWALDVLGAVLAGAGIAMPDMPDIRERARRHLPSVVRRAKPEPRPIATIRDISHKTQTVPVPVPA